MFSFHFSYTSVRLNAQFFAILVPSSLYNIIASAEEKLLERILRNRLSHLQITKGADAEAAALQAPTVFYP